MAFWINAYNAFTVKLIVKNYPIGSITDLSNGNPWDDKWISLDGKSYSLNQIEHDIIRPVWKDARIHFAVNCAARSCPPLANRSFNEGNLDAMLDELTRKFINNRKYNTVSASKLTLSKIFEWYAEDFGSIRDFISRYSSITVNSNAHIGYQEYDWKLNGR